MAPDVSARKIQTSIFAVGFSCIITQLVLMREALGAFAGNELVLGIMLANWLLLMGIGSSFGRRAGRSRRPARLLTAVLILLAVLPSLQIIALRGLRSMVFLRGVSLGVSEIVLTSFLVLLPYCVPAGFGLALGCWMLSHADAPGPEGEKKPGPPERTSANQGAGHVYLLDSLGSVLGGALFSFVLVQSLDHFAALWLPGIFNLLVAVWLTSRAAPTRGYRGSVLTAGAVALGFVWLIWIVKADPDKSSAALQLPGQRLLFLGSSAYGRLAVAEAGGQTNFFENGLLLAAIPNVEQAEEAAHYAMAQKRGAKRVLLIGGLFSGVATEVLRHTVDEVDCVEIDPLAVDVARRFLPNDFNHPRIRFVEADARQFVRATAKKYDVVIVALPDPTTAQLNRFFTDEFFQETRRVLQPGGILSFAVGRYENYASPELISLLSCARQTARRSFPNVLLIPGGRVYFIASDGTLTLDIAPALASAGVSAHLVNAHYLQATLAPDRLADLERASSQPSPLNRDFKPVLYLLQLRHWASQFGRLSGWLTVGIIAATAFYVLRLRRAAWAIFASGFTGSALEIVLLLGLQVLVGSVYRQVGLVVTLFMAGLAAGSGAVLWAESRLGPRTSPATGKALCVLALTLAVLAFLLPLLLAGLDQVTKHGIGPAPAQWAIAVFAFGLAGVAGAQFPLANRLENRANAAEDRGMEKGSESQTVATRLYTADFIGAALGALLTSTVLIPLVGVSGVCGIAATMNLIAVPIIFWKSKAG